MTVTRFAAITPRITGGLSTVSSSLIIYVILKSEKKLSTIYHRIMFGMSCADIIYSFAIALTTLPMPKSVSPEVNSLYSMPYDDWVGSKLGNIQTCEAQGFFLVFGITTMFSYNSMLCLYYACTIAYQMEERNIRKYIEPVLHLFPLTIGCFMAIPPLVRDLYNPSIWEPWCSPTPLCDNRPNTDSVVAPCIRGNRTDYQTVDTIMIVALAILFFIIITSLASVSLRVIMRSRELQFIESLHQKLGAIHLSAVADLPPRRESPVERVRKNHENTKIVLWQALIYILVFVLTLIFPAIQTLGLTRQGSSWPQYLELIFMPLQGFFNLVIFLWHKVLNYRRSHPDVSIFTALRLFFTGKAQKEPVLISRISLLEYDENLKMVKIRLCNENEEEYLSYDASTSAGGDNKIGSAVRERVDHGLLSFPSKNESFHSDDHGVCEPSDDASKRSLSGFDEITSDPGHIGGGLSYAGSTVHARVVEGDDEGLSYA